jgi:hypothetical protein
MGIQSTLHIREFAIRGLPVVHYLESSLKSFPWWVFSSLTLRHGPPQSALQFSDISRIKGKFVSVTKYHAVKTYP